MSEPEWETSVPHLLWRAQNAVHRGMVEAIAGLGVTVTQLGLAVHVEDYGELSASELARRFRLTPQSVTTALKDLEELGWLTRRPHPQHGRVVLYALTRAGRRGVATGRSRVAGARRDLDALLGAEAQPFADTLRRLVTGLED